jgi:hypothetical protein
MLQHCCGSISRTRHQQLVGVFFIWKNMKISWDDYFQKMEKQTCSKPPTRQYQD